MAEAFAQQAATAIEHARLYQEAQERALFAKAMVNIAVRLNSALAEPADIHELICAEGAKALQANYALLYVPGNNGYLVLLDAFVNEQDLPTPALDKMKWPPIHPHEYEAQTLNSLQPVLVQFDHMFPQHVSQVLPALLPSWSSSKHASMKRTPQDPYSSGYITAGGLRWRSHTLREALVQRFVYTAILAPLIARNEPVGLLVLARAMRPGTNDKKSFCSVDLSQAQDFAEQAAIAFTNARLYQQLRDAHRRQQELDQLKDQFMITASHELRTPLTAVLGYLELVAQFDETLAPTQRQEFLQKARRGCDELVLLLSNVMDASQLELESGLRPAHIERVPVREMIQSVIDLIEPHLTQERREVYMDIPAHLSVRADAGRLRQVLLNLSMNALKYSEQGTPIAFAARAVMDVVPSVIISVVDKGKGIAPQQQGHLFQRFYRLERDVNSPVRGTGLGLYISRRLIEAMDGKIGVESTGIEGAGSMFYIQLPMP
jgi:signal transduction histidine kinase